MDALTIIAAQLAQYRQQLVQHEQEATYHRRQADAVAGAIAGLEETKAQLEQLAAATAETPAER